MVSTRLSLIRRRMQICKRGGMSKPLAPSPILVKHPQSAGVTRTAQTLYSGMRDEGSNAAFVKTLAAASA